MCSMRSCLPSVLPLFGLKKKFLVTCCHIPLMTYLASNTGIPKHACTIASIHSTAIHTVMTPTKKYYSWMLPVRLPKCMLLVFRAITRTTGKCSDDDSWKLTTNRHRLLAISEFQKLTFKTRLNGKTSLWMWVLFAWEYKIKFASMGLHFASLWNTGLTQLGNDLLWQNKIGTRFNCIYKALLFFSSVLSVLIALKLIPKYLDFSQRVCSNLMNIETVIGGTSSCESRIFQKTSYAKNTIVS